MSAAVEPITSAIGTGSGSQNFGQDSGSNDVSGGMSTVSPRAANPCAPGVHYPCSYHYAGGPVNVGPGAGGRNMGSASGSCNTFNGQATILSGQRPPHSHC
ncbi:hypothetical protein SLEP1_g40046 [Rubroshorea leprosula]|uniref:Uncharacterized protein n=1 Tax=Rubroshorea leprosula TaxID=152421 RepID=A0AAV5L2U5_9ROSI|nr:hypothetical protein SLEP1_g40046 [Rubroshorea leprosula]